MIRQTRSFWLALNPWRHSRQPGITLKNLWPPFRTSSTLILSLTSTPCCCPAWRGTSHIILWNWKVRTNCFRNKGFQGLYVKHAIQGVRFRLDRGGVELRSEAMAAVAAIPREFIFDRPFAIFIRRREGTTPFFAMYVANSELLTKAPAESTATELLTDPAIHDPRQIFFPRGLLDAGTRQGTRVEAAPRRCHYQPFRILLPPLYGAGTKVLIIIIQRCGWRPDGLHAIRRWIVDPNCVVP